MASSRHDMTDAEWLVLRSVLPTGRQGPMRKNDRRVFDGIFFRAAQWHPMARPAATPRSVHDLLQTAAIDGARTGPGRRSWRSYRDLSGRTTVRTAAEPGT